MLEKFADLTRQSWFRWGLGLGLFIFLSLLRIHEYERTPEAVHAEELLFGWSGLHLVEYGRPRSWSALDYPDEYIYFDGVMGDPNGLHLGAKVVDPWLDEPPLFSLMLGWISHWYGDDPMMVIPASHMRIPTVLASLVTLGLIGVIAGRWFGYWTGILAMLIYGSSPVMVFGSRLAVPENLMALGALLCLWLAGTVKKLNWKWGLLVGGLSFLLGLMKPTGWMLAPLGMFLAVRNKQWLSLLWILGLTAASVGIFVAYGYYFDAELFKHIVSIQGGRFAGWTGWSFMLVTPAFDIFEFMDGWYIWALLASIALLFRPTTDERLNLVKMFLVYWWWVAVVGGTEQDLLPWYWYATFPFLAILGGWSLVDVIQRVNFFTLSLIIGLLGTGRYHLHNAFRPTSPPWVFRIVVLCLLSPSLLGMLGRKEMWDRVARMIVVLMIVVGAMWNWRYIYSAYAIRCESLSCPINESTGFSETRIPFFWRWLVPGDSKGMLDERRPWI